MVLFTVFCKVVLTFQSVDGILKCDQSNKATAQYFPVVLLFYNIALYGLVLTLDPLD